MLLYMLYLHECIVRQVVQSSAFESSTIVSGETAILSLHIIIVQVIQHMETLTEDGVEGAIILAYPGHEWNGISLQFIPQCDRIVGNESAGSVDNWSESLTEVSVLYIYEQSEFCYLAKQHNYSITNGKH